MAEPVISVKLIVLYRFLSHNFPRSKTMWVLANSSIWHTKMLLNFTIPHPTTPLNVFLSQFPSFSLCLEQRTVWNTRGPFLVLFYLIKDLVFVPKNSNYGRERCKGKTLLDASNKLLNTKSLLTSPITVLPYSNK